MSSFICSPKHFASLEKKAKELILSNKIHTYGLKEFSLYMYETTQQEGKIIIERLFSELRELNVVAVSLQYRHHYVGRLDQEIEEQLEIVNEKESPVFLTNAGFYNALRCLNYQIEMQHIEGMRDDLNTCYAFLQRLTDLVAHDLAAKASENDQVGWSL